jgi:hypothetical protein
MWGLTGLEEQQDRNFVPGSVKEKDGRRNGSGVSKKERRRTEEVLPGGCRLPYLIMHNFQGKR